MEGATTNVPFVARFRALIDLHCIVAADSNDFERSNDEHMSDKEVNVFPRPISSARIPPRGSSGVSEHVFPVITCRKL